MKRSWHGFCDNFFPKHLATTYIKGSNSWLSHTYENNSITLIARYFILRSNISHFAKQNISYAKGVYHLGCKKTTFFYSPSDLRYAAHELHFVRELTVGRELRLSARYGTLCLCFAVVFCFRNGWPSSLRKAELSKKRVATRRNSWCEASIHGKANSRREASIH